MATSDEISQEKLRIAERIARLDTERAKLAEQLNELEIAERVLSRFSQGDNTTPRRRGRPAKASPVGTPERRVRPATSPQAGLSLSDAALKAAEAHPQGATAGDLLRYMARELGMAVRPNHLGIALQRHRRAGRLDNRDERWYLPAQSEPPSASLNG